MLQSASMRKSIFTQSLNTVRSTTRLGCAVVCPRSVGRVCRGTLALTRRSHSLQSAEELPLQPELSRQLEHAPIRRRRRRARPTHDSTVPKRPKTAYVLFMSLKRAELQRSSAISFEEIGRKAGELWRSLSADERKVSMICRFVVSHAYCWSSRTRILLKRTGGGTEPKWNNPVLDCRKPQKGNNGGILAF